MEDERSQRMAAMARALKAQVREILSKGEPTAAANPCLATYTRLVGLAKAEFADDLLQVLPEVDLTLGTQDQLGAVLVGCDQLIAFLEQWPDQEYLEEEEAELPEMEEGEEGGDGEFEGL